MARIQDPRENAPEINLISMVDVIFLLIIFFLFVSEWSNFDNFAPVRLPEASQAKTDPMPAPGRIVVNLLANGTFMVTGSALDFPALKSMLAAECALSRRLNEGKNHVSLTIRADEAAPSGALRRLFILCLDPQIGITEMYISAYQPESKG